MAEPTSFALEALYLALRLSLPALGVAFALGLLLAFVQILTQMRESAVSAIPRLLGVGLVVALSFGALSGELLSFAGRIYRALPELVADR